MKVQPKNLAVLAKAESILQKNTRPPSPVLKLRPQNDGNFSLTARCSDVSCTWPGQTFSVRAVRQPCCDRSELTAFTLPMF